ncbi:hypothetical protein JHD53_01915 [Peptacetobacter hiranonis]|uniref:hypothetical protein n=1 Tax=Peptacetobacter hiranonis TaxID=89152 RepID=UPI00031B93AD|nr:hypothetical protein [Peptacetobacter hiranonis]QEK21659.1 hypothetical protein KGNDJEFE_02153 [Peptacetobacter hiranonis]QQQ86876.1 hypothetical protein JHD53_01915 [Peptacetobacter hiranonis]
MNEKIYFSKLQFTHTTYGRELDRLLLDLDSKELSFQTFEYVKNMPSIIGYGYYDVFGELILSDFTNPGILVKSCKNNFNKQIISIEKEEKIVTFSYGIKLSDLEIKLVREYCNALEFEKYRGLDIYDYLDTDGYIGYRDEISLEFEGITNSYIPRIRLSMDIIFDNEHSWPTEKLYNYLMNVYIRSNKELKKRMIPRYAYVGF